MGCLKRICKALPASPVQHLFICPEHTVFIHFEISSIRGPRKLDFRAISISREPVMLSDIHIEDVIIVNNLQKLLPDIATELNCDILRISGSGETVTTATTTTTATPPQCRENAT